MYYRDMGSGATTSDFFTAKKWYDSGSNIALMEVRSDGKEHVVTEWHH